MMIRQVQDVSSILTGLTSAVDPANEEIKAAAQARQTCRYLAFEAIAVIIAGFLSYILAMHWGFEAARSFAIFSSRSASLVNIVIIGLIAPHLQKAKKSSLDVLHAFWNMNI